MPAEDAVIAAPLQQDYDWMSVGQWQAKHQAYCDEASKGALDYVFYGDSITEALPQSEAWKKFSASRRAAAFGISGDRTAQLRWRIENGECAGIAPKAAFLLIGVNNFCHLNHSSQEVASGIMACALGLRAKLPQSKLFIFCLMPAGELKSDPLRRKIRDANALIRALDDQKQTRVIDLESHFLDANKSIPRALMADFLHPTGAGYEAWLTAVEALL